MLLQEFVIESIRPYPQLYDLSNEDYKDNKEKLKILQTISDDFNSRCDVMDSDGKRSVPNLKGIILMFYTINIYRFTIMIQAY